MVDTKICLRPATVPILHPPPLHTKGVVGEPAATIYSIFGSVSRLDSDQRKCKGLTWL